MFGSFLQVLQQMLLARAVAVAVVPVPPRPPQLRPQLCRPPQLPQLRPQHRLWPRRGGAGAGAAVVDVERHVAVEKLSRAVEVPCET